MFARFRKPPPYVTPFPLIVPIFKDNKEQLYFQQLKDGFARTSLLPEIVAIILSYHSHVDHSTIKIEVSIPYGREPMVEVVLSPDCVTYADLVEKVTDSLRPVYDMIDFDLSNVKGKSIYSDPKPFRSHYAVKEMPVPAQPELREIGQATLTNIQKNKDVNWNNLLTGIKTKYPKYSQLALLEYQKFLSLKILTADYFSKRLSPSELLDPVWHIHLASGTYEKDCQHLCGFVIAHTKIPEPAITAPRYLDTCQLYWNYFGKPKQQDTTVFFDLVDYSFVLEYVESDEITPITQLQLIMRSSGGCG